ncbi:MAG: SWIM zinc finger family protein, partial [Planctomycetota bacterium]
MATQAIEHAYRYPFTSMVVPSASEPALRLVTTLEGTSDDLFFDGRIRHPARIGRLLSVLTSIIRTRFYQPLNPLILDPVVTSGGGTLRFEGFSSCCTVYARVDLDPEAFDSELCGKGTTNVDFGNSMHSALQ